MDLHSATVRFAGDSGDGMQLTGMQFTNTSAIFGNDVSTFPDFPAEIRAPAGTVYGVSGFQLHFSSEDIFTPGDELDTLVAMNPAALKMNIAELKKGGILITNLDSFNDQNLKLAGYSHSPLADGSLDNYRVHSVRMTEATLKAVEELETLRKGEGKEFSLSKKDAARCKNFFALGLVCWLYGRKLDSVVQFINDKFAKNLDVRDANLRVLNAGFYYGETAEVFQNNFKVRKAALPTGKYREMRGNEALALGLTVASQLAGKPLFYGSYPITPATDILHELAKHKSFGVRTFQAEDEIAAMASTIGAAFAGTLAATASSGPGIALKGEAMGLAVMLELPMIIINVQRGGPSTGLPTKTEQADLFQAILGRNGECPMVVLAAARPTECFDIAIQAVRIAFRSMTPVLVLTDGYLANSTEPWLVPDISTLEPIEMEHPTEPNGPDGAYLPYKRDEWLARPWGLPGTPGLMHRIGGLEKAAESGNVSYDPDNHERMVHLRQAKVDKVAEYLPEQTVFGQEDAETLVIGWGGTYGALREACTMLRAKGHKVAHAHLRCLNPFPRNLGDIIKRHKRVLVPELNGGQLCMLLRAKYLVDAQSITKIKGRPFMVTELYERIEAAMTDQKNGK
jgi:2-oxoglutarate ferredoxin oxidoreductase subunit alpha